MGLPTPKRIYEDENEYQVSEYETEWDLLQEDVEIISKRHKIQKDITENS